MALFGLFGKDKKKKSKKSDSIKMKAGKTSYGPMAPQGLPTSKAQVGKALGIPQNPMPVKIPAQQPQMGMSSAFQQPKPPAPAMGMSMAQPTQQQPPMGTSTAFPQQDGQQQTPVKPEFGQKFGNQFGNVSGIGMQDFMKKDFTENEKQQLAGQRNEMDMLDEIARKEGILTMEDFKGERGDKAQKIKEKLQEKDQRDKLLVESLKTELSNNPNLFQGKDDDEKVNLTMLNGEKVKSTVGELRAESKFLDKKGYIVNNIRQKYNIPDKVSDTMIFEDYKKQNAEAISQFMGQEEQKYQEIKQTGWKKAKQDIGGVLAGEGVQKDTGLAGKLTSRVKGVGDTIGSEIERYKDMDGKELLGEYGKMLLRTFIPGGREAGVVFESGQNNAGASTATAKIAGDTLGVLNDVVNTAGAKVIPQAFNLVKEQFKANPLTAPIYQYNKAVFKKIASLADTDLGKELIKEGLGAIKSGGKRMDKFKEENPVAFKNLNSYKEIVEGVGNIMAGEQLYKAGKQALPGIKKQGKELVVKGQKEAKVLGEKAVSKAKGLITKKPTITTEPVILKTKKGKKILDIISEPETARNIKLATDQGRVLTPKQSGLSKKLFGTSKKKIVPTKKLIRAQNVIEKQIGGLSDDTTKALAQIKGEGAKMAKELAPELKKMKVGTMTKWKKEAKNMITDNILDNKQVSSLITPKQVKELKGIVAKIDNIKNADDLWKLRQAYDKSVSQSVKSATNLSSDMLQFRQDIWHDTRSIMNNALDDVAKKYGKKDVLSKFQDMSSLYEAGENIVSKAPKQFKATEGLISKKNIIKGAIGAAGVGGAANILRG